MRLKHSTLDHLPSSTFRDEIELARAVRAGGAGVPRALRGRRFVSGARVPVDGEFAEACALVDSG